MVNVNHPNLSINEELNKLHYSISYRDHSFSAYNIINFT